MSSNDRKPRHVLDPEWEETLRRGQEADGGSGSVERELEVVHFLRHLREPEPLSDARFDEIFEQVSQETGGRTGASLAWIKKRWYVWVAPLAAAAAVVLIVVAPPGSPGEDRVAVSDKAEENAAATPGGAIEGTDALAAAPAAEAADEEDMKLAMAERSAQAQALEKQFEILEAKARAEVGRSVEQGRAAGRSGLFDLAKSAGTSPTTTPTSTVDAEPPVDVRTRSSSAKSDAAGVGAMPASKPAEAKPRASKPSADPVDAYDQGGQ